MPSAVIVGRASFPPFAFSSAITGMAKKIEITLFQVFRPFLCRCLHTAIVSRTVGR